MYVRRDNAIEEDTIDDAISVLDGCSHFRSGRWKQLKFLTHGRLLDELIGINWN